MVDCKNIGLLLNRGMIMFIIAAWQPALWCQQKGEVKHDVTGQELMHQGQKLILINGVVIDAATEAAIPNVQFSVSGKGGGVTDGAGLFSLFAVMYDTIEFRMVGYKPSVLAVGSSFTASKYLVMVPMHTDTLIIGEVVVIPQLPNLRSVAEGATLLDSREFGNARDNISISVHQGLTGANRMGDPAINYELLRKQQQIDAFEKGGIPGDRMVSVSPFIIIPAIYLLVHGMPEKPPAPQPRMSERELEQLRKVYRDLLINKR